MRKAYDAWATQEKGKNVVVGGVDPGEVFVRSENVVEEMLSPRLKIEFEDTAVLH